MKVDAHLPFGLNDAAETARDREAAGYSGIWTAETAHDPFLPLCSPPSTPSEIELGTSIAVAFARNPMLLANIGWDLQSYSKRPLHPRSRESDQAAHHEALLDGVESSGAADARADPRRAGDLGHVAERHAARLPRRVLHGTP